MENTLPPTHSRLFSPSYLLKTGFLQLLSVVEANSRMEGCCNTISVVLEDVVESKLLPPLIIGRSMLKLVLIFRVVLLVGILARSSKSHLCTHVLDVQQSLSRSPADHRQQKTLFRYLYQDQLAHRSTSRESPLPAEEAELLVGAGHWRPCAAPNISEHRIELFLTWTSRTGGYKRSRKKTRL